MTSDPRNEPGATAGLRLSLRTSALLAAGLVALAAFAGITRWVIEGNSTGFDRSVSLWAHGFDDPTLDILMRAITFLGAGPAVVGFVVVGAALALWRNGRVPAGVLVAVAVVAEILNVSLKHLFQRARPDLFSKIALPTSYSFPSGHALVSAAVYGMAAIVVARLYPRLRAPLYLGALLLVFLIGLSRVYLGVHWPTDVLGGFALGGFVLVTGIMAGASIGVKPIS